MVSVDSLVEQIKKKRDFSVVNSDFLKSFVEDYVGKERLVLDSLKPKDEKELVSEIRGKLRVVVGVFQNKNVKKRVRILDSMDGLDSEKIKELLETHWSTKERINDYEKLYDKLFAFSKEIKILDLGCGLNPLAFLLKSKNVDYHGIDISELDIEFLKTFFEKFKLKGKFESSDILNYDFKEAYDICLMFKVLDAVETLERGSSEDLIKKIQCKKFVVSFATKTLSGKSKIAERKWFEKILVKNKWDFEILEFDNEIYYIFEG